ncbi:MAG: hypothetical protein R6U63_01170 [Longimicrobiales bacterium]
MNRLRPIPMTAWSVAGWGPVFLVLALPVGLGAQERAHRFHAARVDVPHALAPAAPGTLSRGVGAAALRPQAVDETEVVNRAVAGVIGSAVGLGLGVTLGAHDVWGCHSDALGCFLVSSVLGGTAGSVAGTVLGVRLVGGYHGSAVNTRATVMAAAFGALTGALVGAGMGAATGSDAGVVVGFALTQGTLAAMASVLE